MKTPTTFEEKMVSAQKGVYYNGVHRATVNPHTGQTTYRQPGSVHRLSGTALYWDDPQSMKYEPNRIFQPQLRITGTPDEIAYFLRHPESGADFAPALDDDIRKFIENSITIRNYKDPNAPPITVNGQQHSAKQLYDGEIRAKIAMPIWLQSPTSPSRLASPPRMPSPSRLDSPPRMPTSLQRSASPPRMPSPKMSSPLRIPSPKMSSLASPPRMPASLQRSASPPRMPSPSRLASPSMSSPRMPASLQRPASPPRMSASLQRPASPFRIPGASSSPFHVPGTAVHHSSSPTGPTRSLQPFFSSSSNSFSWRASSPPPSGSSQRLPSPPRSPTSTSLPNIEGMIGWRASDGIFRLVFPSERQVKGRAAITMKRDDLIAICMVVERGTGDSSSLERMNREELTKRIENALNSRGRIFSY